MFCLHIYVYVGGYVCTHRMHAWYLWKPKEGSGTPGIGVQDSYKLPCVCWELS